MNVSRKGIVVVILFIVLVVVSSQLPRFAPSNTLRMYFCMYDSTT